MGENMAESLEKLLSSALAKVKRLLESGTGPGWYLRIRLSLTKNGALRLHVHGEELTAEDTVESLTEWVRSNLTGQVPPDGRAVLELMRTGATSPTDTLGWRELRDVVSDGDDLPEPSEPSVFVGADSARVAGNAVSSAIVATNGQLLWMLDRTLKAFLSQGEEFGELALLVGELKGFRDAMSEVNATEERREMYRAGAQVIESLGPYMPAILQGLASGVQTAPGAMRPARRRDVLVATLETSGIALGALIKEHPELLEPSVTARLVALVRAMMKVEAVRDAVLAAMASDAAGNAT